MRTEPTEFERSALSLLNESGPLWPEDFYRRMWPQGEWGAGGKAVRGGPSRGASAANRCLGRMYRRGWAFRVLIGPKCDKLGPWVITKQGQKWLHKEKTCEQQN
jgi:hypothetical protein